MTTWKYDQITPITGEAVKLMQNKTPRLAAVWEEIPAPVQEQILGSWSARLQKAANRLARKTTKTAEPESRLAEELITDLSQRGGLAEIWFDLDTGQQMMLRRAWEKLLRRRVFGKRR